MGQSPWSTPKPGGARAFSRAAASLGACVLAAGVAHAYRSRPIRTHAVAAPEPPADATRAAEPVATASPWIWQGGVSPSPAQDEQTASTHTPRTDSGEPLYDGTDSDAFALELEGAPASTESE